MLDLTARWADAWNTAWFGARGRHRRGSGSPTWTRRATRSGAIPARSGAPSASASASRAQPADDGKSTDADAAGLADIFDEHAALGFADALIWSLAKTPAALERIAEARRIHLRAAAAASRR